MGVDPLQQRKHRELVRKHLSRMLDRLFAEFTGLHYHIAWAPSPPREWATRTLPKACSVCCRISGSPLLPDCKVCGPRQVARAMKATPRGLAFTCRLGVRNHWCPIRIRGETMGIAYLQALDHPVGNPTVAKRNARAGRKRRSPSATKPMNRAQFSKATRLLHLIIEHAQAASLTNLLEADLKTAGQAVVALESEQVRLHESSARPLPPQGEILRPTGHESHSDQHVHQLLQCIEQRYSKSITLRRCAAMLGMNAAYASTLFSRAMGVPFKTYLTELRITKAKTLLSDPTLMASEVAYAVGYSSENRFRLAFKKATRLSPKQWRETMQVAPFPSEFLDSTATPGLVVPSPRPTAMRSAGA